MHPPVPSDRPQLSSLDTPVGLRSDSHHFTTDLWGPALRRATRYRRAAGFFSSSVLSVLAEPFETFFLAGGEMTLVTCPVLRADDLAALAKGYYLREVADLPPDVGGVFEALARRRIGTHDVLRFLVHAGRLRMFLARPTVGNDALYHEKFAIFEDGRHTLAVSGSVNESRQALVRNFERLEAWRSWQSSDEARTVRRLASQFDRLVADRTEGLTVVPLLVALREGWLTSRETTPSEAGEGDSPSNMATGSFATAREPETLVPSNRALYGHQQRALTEWAASGGRGLLAMATGSGKTVTALSVAARLFDGLGARPLAIVIVAPYIHLVDQWCAVAREFGLDPIRCAEGHRYWASELSAAISALNAGRRRVLSVAVTSATLQSPTFRDAIARIRMPLLVIGDEAHNFGSPGVARSLPRNAMFRLGLSATPKDWKGSGTASAVEEYFGPIVFEYGLEEAIREGVLTPYMYHPILVELTDDEAETYEELTERLARYGVSGAEEGDLPQAAKFVLMRRARLLGAARLKLPMLRELMTPMRRSTHVLVYCGDGRVEGEDDEAAVRQVDAVIGMLEADLGMRCARYTSETSPEQRSVALRAFDEGLVQVLVAIRCLDEGVDVPSTRIAVILASGTNPRQFVQRRGRVLRRSPKTGKEYAVIHDFFVVPPGIGDRSGTEQSRAMRRMFGRQIKRVLEFSSLALNGPVARQPLMELSKRLGMLEAWGDDDEGEGPRTGDPVQARTGGATAP